MPLSYRDGLGQNGFQLVNNLNQNPSSCHLIVKIPETYFGNLFWHRCDQKGPKSPRYCFLYFTSQTDVALINRHIGIGSIVDVLGRKFVFSPVDSLSPKYQITNSRFVFPCISYRSSGEKLLKCH